MPPKCQNVRYRVVTRGGQKIRLAFQGDKVIQAKNLETGKTHTPAEFAKERSKKASHKKSVRSGRKK